MALRNLRAQILSNRCNDECHDANKLKVLEHEAVADNDGCNIDGCNIDGFT